MPTPQRITGRSNAIINPQQYGVETVDINGRQVVISYAELADRIGSLIDAAGSWIPLVTGEEPSDFGVSQNLVTDGTGGLILVWTD